MSDYFELQDQAASQLEQPAPPDPGRGLPPLEPIDPATRRLKTAPPLSATDLQDQAAAWQESGNVRDWLDELNDQAAFLAERKHMDPSGGLQDRYLSAVAIGQLSKLDPGFVFDNLELFTEQIMGEKLPVPTLGKAIANAWKAGWIGNRIAMLQYELATGASGDRGASIQAQIQDYQTKLPPPDPYGDRFIRWALEGTFGSLALWIESGLEGAKMGLVAAGAAALTTAMESAISGAALSATGVGAGPALLTTTSATAAAALTAFFPAAALGTNLRMSQLMIGQSYESLSQLKDANGRQIRPWLRSALAISLGLIQAKLENMQLETVLASLGPKMYQIFGEGMQIVTRDTVLKTVGNRALKAAARWGVDGATEGLEEGSQQLVQRMGEQLAKYIENKTAGAGFDYMSVRELVTEIRDATALGAVAGFLMVAPGHIFSPLAESLSEREAVRSVEQQKRAGERQQVIARLQAELQKGTEAEGRADLAPSAAEVKPVAALEAAPEVQYEKAPAEIQVQPGTFGQNAALDLVNAQAWAYTPEEWARIEQARVHPGGINLSGLSIYKDFYVGEMAEIRAKIEAAAPPGMDVDAIDMTGLLLDTVARATGNSTPDFVREMFAPGIFATPEQIQALPARLLEEAKRKGEAAGLPAEQVAEEQQKALIKVAAAKGVTEWFQDGKALVYLFRRADISTVVEEFGHIMRRRLPAPMLEAAARWCGVVDGVWSEEAEEKFVNGLLEYLRQGLAPNEEVKTIFERLGQWLEYIYKAIRDRWQLSPEIVQVYDSLFADRRLGQKLNTDPNPRPADSLKVLFQVDPATALETDPAKVPDEEFLKQSEYQDRIATHYFDANGARRVVPGQDGRPEAASSRTVPVVDLRLQEGQWLIDDKYKGIYGHEIAQLRSLDPASLQLAEEDYTTGVNWEGRGDDARRYASWIRQGLTPPPITVLETERGSLRVTDGHRRVAAAKLTGTQVLAWVWPAMDHPKGLIDQGTMKVMRVGLTYEAAKGREYNPNRLERYLFQVDPKVQERLNEAAVKVFGTTEDPAEAGYILSDGRMLDFSGRHEEEDPKRKALYSGSRNLDHRAIEQIKGLKKVTFEGKKVQVSWTYAMQDFMARAGAMRVDGKAGAVSSMQKPTEAQYKRLEGIVKDFERSLYIDVVDADGRSVAFRELPKNKAWMIRDFFEAADYYQAKPQDLLWQRDPAREDAFNKVAKEFFGTTTDLAKSAYILSTGELLNFDNRWGATKEVNVGGRLMHQLIGKVPTIGMIDAVNQALRNGAIRMDYDPAYSILQTMRDPTDAQYDAIQRLCSASKRLQVEKVDPRTGEMLAFKEFLHPNLQTIRDFFTAAQLYSPDLLFQTDPWLMRSSEVVRLNIKAPIPGKQVKQILAANKVGPDEMHWTGMDEWLEDEKKYGRNDLLEYLAGHAIKVEEHLYGAPEAGYTEAEFIAPFPPGQKPQYADIRWRTPVGENYRELVFTLPFTKEDPDPARRRRRIIPGHEADANQIHDQLEDVHRRIRELWDSRASKENYQAGRDQLDIEEQKLINMMDRYTEAEIPEQAGRWPRMWQPYQGGHYTSLQNVIGWIRTLDQDLGGKKTFMVDEFQSEWAERAKAEGLGDPRKAREILQKYEIVVSGFRGNLIKGLADLEKAVARETKAKAELDRLIDVPTSERDPEGKWRKAFDKADRAHRRAVARRQQIRSAISEAESMIQVVRNGAKGEIANLTNVPPAPFIASRRWGIVVDGEEYKTQKGQTQRFVSAEEAQKFITGQKLEKAVVADLGYIENTAAWGGYEFKRALRWAVEHGYDKLAWTDGATQNKRWSLSRFIHELEWTKQPDGNYTINGWTDEGNVGAEKADIPPEKLAEYVGRKPADLILAGQNDLSDTEDRLLDRGLTTEIFQERIIANAPLGEPLNRNVWYIRFENGEVMGTWPTEDAAKNDARQSDADIREWRAEPTKRTTGTLRGQNIETGGEFMKLLYDKLQVEFAKKYVKQWNGSVHDEQLPLGTPVLLTHERLRYQLYDPQFDLFDAYPNLAVAEEEAANQNERAGAEGEPGQGWYVIDQALTREYELQVGKNLEGNNRFVLVELSTGEEVRDPDSPDDPIFFLTRQEAWDWANHNLEPKPSSQTLHVVDVTPEMKASVKNGIFQQFLMQPDSHELSVQEAVVKGGPVPDSVLELYKDRDWAKAEIQARERYVQEAQSAQFRDADEFISFHDAMGEPGEAVKSYEYWQLIWEKAGGNINVAGEEGFTPVPPAEANKRFLRTVDTPEKMGYFLLNLDALAHEDATRKAGVIGGAAGLPKAIYFAYIEAKKTAAAGELTTNTWAAAYKVMKTDPERYREIAAALGDEEEQRQLAAERTMPPAEETRLRRENERLRRELKVFREAELEELAKTSYGKRPWELSQEEWIASWPADEKKPLKFLDRHESIVAKAIAQGLPVPPEAVAAYPKLRKLLERRAAPAPAAELAAAPEAAEEGEHPEIARLQARIETRAELEAERKALSQQIKEWQTRAEVETKFGQVVTKAKERLAVVKQKLVTQKVRERMQKRLFECYDRRMADREAWRLRAEQRAAKIKRDSIIARLRQIQGRLPNMEKEAAEPIRKLLASIDLAYMGQKAVADLSWLRIQMRDPDFEVPPSMLDLLDRIDQRNIQELTDQELKDLRDAIVHWVEVNQEDQMFRIGRKRARAEQVLSTTIAEMKPPKELEEELQRLFPNLAERAREKGTTIVDEMLGIGQSQWILIVENLAGRDSMMFQILGQEVEEGRRRQLDLKFKYEDFFQNGLKPLKIANLPYWLHESQVFDNAGRNLELRRGEKMALYMLGQDEDARASVLGAGAGSRRRRRYRNRPFRISEDVFSQIEDGLSEQEKGFVEVVNKLFDMTYDDMNEVYEERYGHPLEKIPKWYHKDVMASGRRSTIEEEKATEEFRKRNLRPGVPKGRIKQRKGVVVPLYVNSIEHDVMEAINYAARYGGLEIPIYEAQKLLMNPDFRTALVDSYGERVFSHLLRGLRDVVVEAEALSTVENFFAKTREMLTIGYLSINPFSMLKIFLGFANASIYVHADHLVAGYAEAVAHPIRTDQVNQAMSPYYRDRVTRGFTRDLAEGLQSLEAAGLIHARRTAAQIGMLPIQLADKAAVSPVMRGAVLQVLSEVAAGELSKETLLGIGHLVKGKDLAKLTPAEVWELAYRFADFVVTRTQDQRLAEYRSALSRATTLGGFTKFFTMFGSNTNTNLNIIRRAIGEFNRAKDKGKAGGRLARILFLTLVVVPAAEAMVNALRAHLLKRYGDDDDEQKKKWLSVLADYARNVAGLSYFIRDLADGAITILQKHRVSEFTVPPVQLMNDSFEVMRRGFAWVTATNSIDRNRRMWSFLDKASDFLFMVGEIPLVMPKRYLVEYLRRRAAGE